MPDHWVVRAAFEGDPDADWLMRLEDELDQQRLDASVSAQPLDETWTVTRKFLGKSILSFADSRLQSRPCARTNTSVERSGRRCRSCSVQAR
jgi:hypothetical protein